MGHHPEQGAIPVRRSSREAAAIGWISLGLGVFLTIAPGPGAALMGFGDRPRLARAVGAGDLAIGAVLLLGRDPARGMGARAAGNGAIAGLCGWSLARGTPHRGRALGLLVAMLGVIPIDLRVARRLRSVAHTAAPPAG